MDDGGHDRAGGRASLLTGPVVDLLHDVGIRGSLEDVD
jgi:hypothetical protein